MKLIDGKATATAVKEEIAEEVRRILANGGKQPHLAAVLVGHEVLKPMSRIRSSLVSSVDSSLRLSDLKRT